ncbi:MAG: TIGR03936 family radical SAM-associated protein [Acidimicrobiales bacterium]|jgi:radical SAM-linked protein|nr:TIGR03936 family radical SAM-associated protein [Acidimicrobiales bacterium]
MRLRIRYSKKGKVRFISHRDVARIWERALRRVGVSVAYSQGFSPRPKLSFGLALSTGHESEAEFLDLELSDEDGDWTAVRGVDLAARLTAALPVGLDVVAVAPVEKGDSLQQAVTSCTWAIEVDDVDREYMDAWVAGVLSREEIVVERERKGKPVVEDLRPHVLALDVTGTTETGIRLSADLGTQPRALRPTELLAAMDPPLTARTVCRMNQWMSQGDGREEPLMAPTVPAPSARVPA